MLGNEFKKILRWFAGLVVYQRQSNRVLLYNLFYIHIPNDYCTIAWIKQKSSSYKYVIVQ
jgi:hypothetical protein